MATLSCDLCGGKLVMGSGGIASCETCGMEYNADRMREKIQELKGENINATTAPAAADNSKIIENYLEMAQAAQDAGNNAEAESYCNKIIELDVTNPKAWMLKGEAAAWQSTIQNSRISEGVASFVKAIKNAPEEERPEFVNRAKEQIKKLSVAFITLRHDRFAKWPDKEETVGFLNDITSIVSAVITFTTQTGESIPTAEILGPIADKINSAIVKAWTDVILPEYDGSSDDRANKYEWERFIDRIGHCTTLLEKAIDLCDEDDEEDISRYDNLIFLHNEAIKSCSWDYNFVNGSKSWYKDWTLTEEAKKARRKLIADYEGKKIVIKAKIAAKKAEKERLEKEEAKKKVDAYWAEHAEEKEALEKEQKEIQNDIIKLDSDMNAQINAANKEYDTSLLVAEIANIDAQIAKLTNEKNSLGLFKNKEKTALQNQINALNANKDNISARITIMAQELERKTAAITADFQTKKTPLENRSRIIAAKLTKPI